MYAGIALSPGELTDKTDKTMRTTPPGELENAFNDDSVKAFLDKNEAAVQIYDDVGHQQIYFVSQYVE
ncbi:unnamed protein product [Trichobilharzia regenti]|uniref:Exported protein n=1 Tax=Trichobilharzia regenti TaxID=157069 RepID=A0A183X4U3_TRIRE|nr:unnamed protein product [Trichobilharzia regenti]VDQ15275.1 unnamed protein product [Trichobilharzia regenti]